MTESRTALFRRIFAPWYVKVAAAVAGVPMALGLYDVCCNQFGWPKLPVVWAKTGALVPVWVWFLIVQAALFYALVEFIRLSVPHQSPSEPVSIEPALGQMRAEIGAIAAKADGYAQRMDAVEVLAAKLREDLKISLAKRAAINNGWIAAEKLKGIRQAKERTEAAWQEFCARANEVGYGANEPESVWRHRRSDILLTAATKLDIRPDEPVSLDSVLYILDTLTPGRAENFKRIHKEYVQSMKALERAESAMNSIVSVGAHLEEKEFRKACDERNASQQ